MKYHYSTILLFDSYESILLPRHNRTGGIEKITPKATYRHKRLNTFTQNNVVYNCHFCLHQTLIKERDSPSPYEREMSFKVQTILEGGTSTLHRCKFVDSEEGDISNNNVTRMDEFASPTITLDDPVADIPATSRSESVQLRQRQGQEKGLNQGLRKNSESNSAALYAENSIRTSNKRKKRSWISLKEIADNIGCGNHRFLPDLVIRFTICKNF
ncbi:hypothetical protein Vadar_015467 [Vaccinium darrowii]|uniref:Uncharacterized protein n=1 Tax=Vaccinium darrowii TaxID=229202 RepID=A0ACB7Y731_9ERIC|nr:hypothetical protein Vadar_015467 [Vaccinium darrowii]